MSVSVSVSVKDACAGRGRGRPCGHRAARGCGPRPSLGGRAGPWVAAGVRLSLGSVLCSRGRERAFQGVCLGSQVRGFSSVLRPPCYQSCRCDFPSSFPPSPALHRHQVRSACSAFSSLTPRPPRRPLAVTESLVLGDSQTPALTAFVLARETVNLETQFSEADNRAGASGAEAWAPASGVRCPAWRGAAGGGGGAAGAGAAGRTVPIILFSKLFPKNNMQLKGSQFHSQCRACWRLPISDSHH